MPSRVGISADWPPALTLPRLAVVIRGYPIFPTMPDTQNDDLVLISHIINHQMRLVGMHADRRRYFLSQSRSLGIVGKKREDRAQPFVIGIGLRQSELLDAFEKDGCQIVGCGAR